MKNMAVKQALFFGLSSILGPILFLGGLGYVLDKQFGTNKLFLFVGIGLAFVMTQFFMYRKVKEFSMVAQSHIDASSPVQSEEK
jgi:F0F1-type ATP synthase assembly protein I